MRRANLTGANLSGANLNSADLTGTDLQRADLTATNLTNADLRNTKLQNTINIKKGTEKQLGEPAILTGAKLSGAIWKDGTKCAEGSISACNKEIKSKIIEPKEKAALAKLKNDFNADVTNNRMTPEKTKSYETQVNAIIGPLNSYSTDKDISPDKNKIIPLVSFI